MPDRQPAIISAFSMRLALRPDADRVLALLAASFLEHADDLWPRGEPGATPEWIAGHVYEILAVVERLYGNALCLPVAQEFLDRMAWLPELLADIDHGRA
jgi:hypothetical protein